MTTETPNTPPDPAKIDLSIATAGSTVTDSTITIGDITGRDKIVQGDEVQGDKVLGDKVIINEAPKLRIPLQRPPRATHFQDRKDDLAQLLLDLQPGRVMTLCGPGGIGKTALAAEAIWHLAPGEQPPALFPDGILFHSFYNQPQAAFALEHIARSFGEELKPSPKAAAQRALAGRCVLLILDGTEEADDLRQVVEIRDQCGVLVTSRSHDDEIEKRKDLTPLPLADAILLLQAWGGERAADTTTVSRIAELVGRLPLALRLVGRYLSQNEENASDYLTWLAATPLPALDQGKRREQSITLLLARSLQQVSQRARQTLGIVGLLALAPFTPAPIAAALTLSTPETRQAFGELVNYGLLLRPAEAYEVSHALIHTYARHHLAPADAIVTRLATYHEQTIDQHKNDFAYLKTLHPHVMALLRSASERETWDIVSSLARSIHNYLDLQGLWTDRILTINSALAAVQATQNRRDEGDWLGNLGNAYAALGQVEPAIEHYQHALVIAREIGDRWNEGAWLGNLGSAYRNLGQVEAAIEHYQHALVIAREIGDRWNEGAWLGNLGSAYRNLGQVEAAIEYYQQALVIAREIGDRRNEGTWLGNLGAVYYSLGQVEAAIAHSQQALVIAREIGDRRGEGNRLGNLGNAYYSLGQVEAAIAYHQQALVIAREIGDRRGEGPALGNLGNAYYSLGQVEAAIAYHQQALVIAREIGDRRGEGPALGNLGAAYYSLGQVEAAIAYHQQALVIAREIGDRRGEGPALGNLGAAYYSLGQVAAAIAHYQQALAISKEIGDRRNEGNWLGNLGLAYAGLGQVEAAIEYHQQALVIARAIGDRRGEGNRLGNLGNAYAALVQVEPARQLWQQALHIFEEIKSPSAETVRQWLASMPNENQ